MFRTKGDIEQYKTAIFKDERVTRQGREWIYPE